MYQQAESKLWNGRLDSETEERHFRLFQTVNFEDINAAEDHKEDGIGILGYAIDKGVELNKGRVGAKEGPDAIRKAFSGLPILDKKTVTDYGNVYHDRDELIDTQKEYADYVEKSMAHNNFTFLIGGGHDIAYAQYLGARKANPDASIGFINIDAHFDNRKEKHSTSGTCFRQILDNDDNADYFVLGIQQSGNTQGLFDYAEETNTEFVTADELQGQIAPPIKDKIELFMQNHDIVLFTLCMDVIDSAYAPGVSAPAVLGLTPNIVLELAKRITASDKVNTMSIAEMNPTYDVDNRTAKLIANIMHHVMY
ncbi:formimidoylglutamase [Staphylococcus massiliensis]|uniref:Formimidoylglutamase n=1 Tax=Staphylococcus massiliensis S46 TaxID=1229783 RepID=K9ANX6_9STAP|nr:formimidoylglutamase [Staphylococcus massiliensis]EKU49009.1 formimidoylglutamase [Staphylococcus massiliensis S46]MCG3399452.1 formimidoylglutamase [Staphylococcus massiliensis]MCG3402449.1 formimidoylglutamase [Staphylococcus massiliensis]MCG3411588.1 formimidoylglutamase [Staphylococcus massiliensis]PNZ99485.1 formimidoylglutamase [Staphylococcus massiliensis CCUG 55927]